MKRSTIFIGVATIAATLIFLSSFGSAFFNKEKEGIVIIETVSNTTDSMVDKVIPFDSIEILNDSTGVYLLDTFNIKDNSLVQPTEGI